MRDNSSRRGNGESCRSPRHEFLGNARGFMGCGALPIASRELLESGFVTLMRQKDLERG